MRENTTQMILNDTAKGKSFYRLEFQARVCSKELGAYVIVVFDCCRENLNDPKYRNCGAVAEQESDSAVYRNLFLINGCPPNQEVDAKSSIATELFTKLESCKDANGTIVLPGKLRFWQPGNMGDKTFDIRQDLHFFGPTPRPQDAA